MTMRLHPCIIVLLLAVSVVDFGCLGAMNLSVRGLNVPVTFTPNIGRPYVVVRHFISADGYATPGMNRIFGKEEQDLKLLIEQELRKTPGDAVVNLSIRIAIDYKSFTAEGDIVKFKQQDEIKRIPVVTVDPETGLPIKKKNTDQFDPETGLPKKNP
ncbi:MAG: hypothetical protein ACOYNS_09670 [Bacteroidota bacterium]